MDSNLKKETGILYCEDSRSVMEEGKMVMQGKTEKERGKPLVHEAE